MYTTFHKNEIHLDDIVQVSDWENPEMMLTETNSNLDRWQVDTALATWRAMRNSTNSLCSHSVTSMSTDGSSSDTRHVAGLVRRLTNAYSYIQHELSFLRSVR